MCFAGLAVVLMCCGYWLESTEPPAAQSRLIHFSGKWKWWLWHAEYVYLRERERERESVCVMKQYQYCDSSCCEIIDYVVWNSSNLIRCCRKIGTKHTIFVWFTGGSSCEPKIIFIKRFRTFGPSGLRSVTVTWATFLIGRKVIHWWAPLRQEKRENEKGLNTLEGGLEPPTLWLTATRSNQLSYSSFVFLTCNIFFLIFYIWVPYTQREREKGEIYNNFEPRWE